MDGLPCRELVGEGIRYVDRDAERRAGQLQKNHTDDRSGLHPSGNAALAPVGAVSSTSFELWPDRDLSSTPPKRSSRMPAPVDPTQLYGSRPAPSTRLPTGAAAPEAVDISDLNFLFNAGPSSKRSARAAAQEEHKKVLPPPTGNELRVMSVQQAVDALIEHVNVDSVVRGCCERWQALGYGPGRRQSAAEAGALAAIVGGMRAPVEAAVQEKACLAIAHLLRHR